MGPLNMPFSFQGPRDVQMAHPQTKVFEGRPDRLVPAAMIAYLSFFIAIALLASFTLAVDNFSQLFLGLFEGVLVAFICVTAIASSRLRIFEVDGKGIRCAGRLRSNFDVPWKDVSRIEVVRHRRGAPRVYVLRAPNEAILARFSPVELGTAAGESFASAVQKGASKLGLPICQRIGLC